MIHSTFPAIWKFQLKLRQDKGAVSKTPSQESPLLLWLNLECPPQAMCLNTLGCQMVVQFWEAVELAEMGP